MMNRDPSQRRKIDQVFDDLERAGVNPIKAAAALGITVKNAKRELKKANVRRIGCRPEAGCRQMTPILTRDDSWHSIDMERARLSAYSRSDSPSRFPRVNSEA